MKLRTTLATTAMAVVVLIGIAGSAHAAGVVIPGTGYAGIAGNGPSGTDAWGNPWTWSTTTGCCGVAAGLAAWGNPGLGDGESTYGSSTPATGFEISFVNPLANINETASTSAGGYNEFTRFTADGVAWTPHFIGGNEVVFSAPVGDSLTAGEDFFVNVIFDESSSVVNGSTTGFTAVFTAVPEPASWALMLLGAGMIGGGLRMNRRNTVVLTAA
jgi:PEP-CTERM motif